MSGLRRNRCSARRIFRCDDLLRSLSVLLFGQGKQPSCLGECLLGVLLSQCLSQLVIGLDTLDMQVATKIAEPFAPARKSVIFHCGTGKGIGKLLVEATCLRRNSWAGKRQMKGTGAVVAGIVGAPYRIAKLSFGSSVGKDLLGIGKNVVASDRHLMRPQQN